MPRHVFSEGAQDLLTTASTAANLSNTGTTVISSTLAKAYTLDAPTIPGQEKRIICDTATASTALRTVTSAASFDGTNTFLNFTADNQAISLVALSTARWMIVGNVGTVTATTV